MAEDDNKVLLKLIQKKANILDSVSLLEFYVKEFEKEGKPQAQIQAWSEKTEKLYEDFHHVAVEMESQSTEEEPIDLKGERQKFDGRYYSLRAFYISKLAQPSKTTSSNPPPAPRPLSVRLPELNLPKFSGRLEDWCVFRDSFESAVGSRTDIGAVEKMHYLKGLVQGEAARILDPIKISEQGYKDAWRTLKLRFENKRQLIKCHIKTLFDTPAMQMESSEELLALVDRFEQQLSVLKSLGEPADRWSSLLVYLLTIRLDSTTLREWENHCARLDSDNVAAVLGGTASTSAGTGSDESTSMPSYVTMVNFLQNYSRVLQAISPASSDSSLRLQPKPQLHKSAAFAQTQMKNAPSTEVRVSSFSKSEKPCDSCGQNHHLYQCPEFQKLNVSQRTNLVRQNNTCMNCLRSSSHYARDCPSSRCRVCSMKHHTLLHVDGSDSTSASSTPPSESTCYVALQQQPAQPSAQVYQQSPSVSQTSIQQATTSTFSAPQARVHENSGNPQYALVSTNGAIPGTVFLPTALVNIRDSRGCIVTARCLLDCASQQNFVSGALCERLKLSRNRLAQPITISGIGDTTTLVEFDAVTNISSRVSPFTLKTSMLILPSITVKLPQTSVDVSRWSIPGHIDPADPTFAVTGSIDMILGAVHFFRILRYDRISLGPELPLLQNTEFGWVVSGECTLQDHDSQDSRSCQGSNSCTKLEELGHMREITPEENDAQPQYIIPHDAVLKVDSATTKLRTIFDALWRSKSGISLNDVLLAGPTVHAALITTVLRFRTSVDPTDQTFQRILWRDDSSSSFTVYQLRTITYGTSSAPFLATRVLQKLADDEEHQLPFAAPFLYLDLDADNLLTGSNDATSLTATCEQHIAMPASAGLPLRQLPSNNKTILDAIPLDLRETKTPLVSDHQVSVTTLGLRWADWQEFQRKLAVLPRPRILNHVINAHYARNPVAFPVIKNDSNLEKVHRHSRLRQLLRICTYSQRFDQSYLCHRNREILLDGPRPPIEVDQSLLRFIRRVRQLQFASKSRRLTSTGQVDCKTMLRFLSTQLVDSIIRIGGRLHRADISIDDQQPIVLPSPIRLTDTIATRDLLKTLHFGTGRLLSACRQRVWPHGGRNLDRRVVKRRLQYVSDRSHRHRARGGPSLRVQSRQKGNLAQARGNRACSWCICKENKASPCGFLGTPGSDLTQVKYEFIYVLEQRLCLAPSIIAPPVDSAPIPSEDWTDPFPDATPHNTDDDTICSRSIFTKKQALSCGFGNSDPMGCGNPGPVTWT